MNYKLLNWITFVTLQDIFLISLIFYTLKKNKLFFLWTRNANVSKILIVKQTLFISIKTM